MTIIDNQILWRQFGKAIDSLGDALRACPAELWEKRLWEDHPDRWVAAGFSAFWYLGHHTLFWLDLYLTGAEEGFVPPEPFDLVEIEASEALPHTYTHQELLEYLEYCRRKCQETIGAMSSEKANRLCWFPWGVDLRRASALQHASRAGAQRTAAHVPRRANLNPAHQQVTRKARVWKFLIPN